MAENETAKLQADASGTVVLSGHEDMTTAYDLKISFLEKLTSELEEMKGQLRALARGALASAGSGAKRVFFRNGKKGGIAVTCPDYSMDGNRPVLSDKKMSTIVKVGDLSTLGVEASQLIDEVETEPGGEVIELRGHWVGWFRKAVDIAKYATDSNLKVEKRERTVTRRLKPEAINILNTMAAQGNELAALLLASGTKDLTVKVERT